MKRSICILSISLAALQSVVVPTEAQVNVTQHHNHDSRDGLYVDPEFTQNAAGNLTRDLGFTVQFPATFTPNRSTLRVVRMARWSSLRRNQIVSMH
jgi:hypothetical protein